MNLHQATELYIKHDKCAKEIIRRLMLWDPKLTLPENARKMGIVAAQIEYLKKKMHLKVKMVGKGNYERNV